MILKKVGDIPSQDIPPDKKLEHAIHSHGENAVRYLNEFSVLLHDTKHLQPNLRGILLSKRKQYEEIFLRIIKEGISNKIFVKHEAKMIVYMILGSCNWLYQWFSPKGTKRLPSRLLTSFHRLS